MANTKQIAKAMEIVAATKMRRSQDLALKTRPFATRALQIISRLMLDESLMPALMTQRPLERIACIVITSDKGLAGSFNANVLRRAANWIQERSQTTPVDVITIGRKAREFFTKRFTKANVIKEFPGAGDLVDIAQTQAISDYFQERFLTHSVDQIYGIYTNFKSTLRQEVVTRQLLPLTKNSIQEMIAGIMGEQAAAPQNQEGVDYVLEPSAIEVLDRLLPYLLELEVYHIILESNASEHSARMMAMKKASDNASEIISDLTLLYNKSRQAAITQEIIEIMGGSMNT